MIALEELLLSTPSPIRLIKYSIGKLQMFFTVNVFYEYSSNKTAPMFNN